MGEITVILLLALIFIGPKKLPELASGLGKLIREFRKTTSDVKNEIQLDEAIRKPFEELREAVMLHPEELKRRDRLRKDLDELRRKAEAASANESAAAADQETPSPAAAASIDAVDATIADGSASLPPGVGSSEALGPALPLAPPPGTIARESGVPVPPVPPLDALGPKPSSSPIFTSAPGHHRITGPAPSVTAPASGALSALAAGKADGPRPSRGLFEPRPRTTAPAPVVPENSAADRSNTTQILSDADLAAAAVGPPPPPPSAGRVTSRTAAAPPSLPGATPPKKSEPTT